MIEHKCVRHEESGTTFSTKSLTSQVSQVRILVCGFNDALYFMPAKDAERYKYAPAACNLLLFSVARDVHTDNVCGIPVCY